MKNHFFENLKNCVNYKIQLKKESFILFSGSII